MVRRVWSADGWGKGKAGRRRLFTSSRCSNNMGWLHAGEGDEVTSLLRCPIIVSHWRPLAHKAACGLSVFVWNPGLALWQNHMGTLFRDHVSPLVGKAPPLSLNWDFRCITALMKGTSGGLVPPLAHGRSVIHCRSCQPWLSLVDPWKMHMGRDFTTSLADLFHCSAPSWKYLWYPTRTSQF